jgi:DNA-binding CsgD family transcriptional regulator
MVERRRVGETICLITHLNHSAIQPFSHSTSLNHSTIHHSVIQLPQLHHSTALHPVKRTVLLYGFLAAVSIAALQFFEYRFLVLDHSLEVYGGLVATLFAALGIWLGLKLTRTRVIVREVPVPVDRPFSVNAASVERLGLTPRELEILTLIAQGLSNREIAERLFLSENTVKTHSANLFSKLSAKRRTQAVQLAKEAGVIP